MRLVDDVLKKRSMPTTPVLSYVRHNHAELRCALEIKRYISQGNYRLLKAFLQKFTTVNLPFLYYLNWKYALLSFAVTRFDESLSSSTSYDEEQKKIVELLVAYGFSDKHVEEKHIFFKHSSQNEFFLRAVSQQLRSFSDVKALNHYYRTFVTARFSILSNLDRMEIELLYSKAKMHLSALSDETYWSKVDNFLENLSTAPSKNDLLPYLSECSCHFFDRGRSSRRKQLVHKILNETKARLSRESPLVYLSMGCGGGLQDFELLYHFIKHAYSSIKVILIDEEMRLDMMRQMKELCFLAAEYQIKFEMFFYESIEAYRLSEEFESPNLVCSIDFNNIFAFSGFGDLMTAHACMASDGYYYLSFSEYDVFLDAHRCRGYRIHAHQEAMASVKKHFSTCESFEKLSYASLTQKYSFQEWLELADVFNRPTCQEVSITLIAPKYINKRGYATTLAHQDLNTEHLTYFFKLLFSEAKEKFTLVLVDSLLSFGRYQREQRKEFDVVTLIDHEASEPHAKTLQRWFQSISVRTSYFYRLIVETKQGMVTCEHRNQAQEYPSALPQHL